MTSAASASPQNCPYLDTVDRTVLDFDFEKQCSVTLVHLNVYGCLVCGKFYQGRGINSQAITHSLQMDHHVFINLHTTRIYCLPDNYEVVDSSLDDVKYALNPTYTEEEITELDKNTEFVHTALIGKNSVNSTIQYLPGIVGFNDTSTKSPMNAILQALVRVPLLRDFFIISSNYSKNNSRILDSFGQLVRRVWSKGLFKGQISPHEMIQAISVESKKHFEAKNYEPVEFLSWFLNHLHQKLGGTRKPASSKIHECFQGIVKITTYSKIKRGADRKEIEAEAEESEEFEGYEAKPEISFLPFLHLSLDVPPPPVFTSETERDIIPQVPLYQLLAKFDGCRAQHVAQTSQKKKYLIVSPPKYLILHVKRFTRNQYFTEKNHTIVNFPMKDLDIKEYCRPKQGQSTRYNLLANICHEGEKNEELSKTLTRMEHEGVKGKCLVDVTNKGDDSWYEIQDLNTKQKMPQEIAQSESYLQIYEQV